MTLDDHARRSAAALQEKVELAELRLLEAGLPPKGALGPALASRVLAFAGAFVVVLVGLGMAIVQMVGDQTNVPVTEPPPAPTVTEATPAPTTTPSLPDTSTPAPSTSATVTTTVIDTTPPLLVITSPEDGEVVESELVRFAGVTEPGVVVSRGKFVADVDEEGAWSLLLVVSAGSSRVTFEAVDQAGNTTTAAVTVVYEPPAPEEPTVEFTAYATFGSCSEDPPYDVYYGTAAPGAKITVTSKHGGGATTAGAEGNWELTVVFTGMKYGETIPVTVKDEFGNQKVFEFTSLVG